MHLKPLAEQTIVITGASSGIGLATARLAARGGASVMLAARDESSLRDVVAELEAEGCDVAYTVTDVADEAQIDALAEATIDRFGGFDTWINDAGVGIVATAEQTTSDEHRRLFDTNYFGVVYGSLAAVRHFRETGKTGALINLGSAVSDLPIAYSVAYSASKHAIKGFTDGLRIELAREKLPIAVTLIRPSGIDTPFFEHARSKLGGIGKAPGPNYAPSVVADAIIFAAQHPRRDIPVGATSTIAGPATALVPQLIEADQTAMRDDSLIDYGHMPEADNLFDVPRDGRERSRTGSGRGFSLTTESAKHPAVLPSLGALLSVGLVAFFLGNRASLRR